MFHGSLLAPNPHKCLQFVRLEHVKHPFKYGFDTACINTTISDVVQIKRVLLFDDNVNPFNRIAYVNQRECEG